MLHFPTLLLVLLCFTVLTTVMLVVAAAQAQAPVEQRWWALGNVSIGVGFVLATSPSLPVWLHGGLSYGCMGLGMASILRGVHHFCGLTMGHRTLAGITLGAMAAPLYFAVVQPDQVARLISAGIYLGTLNLWAAVLLVRRVQGSARRAMWLSAAGFAVLGLGLVGRALYLGVHGAQARVVSPIIALTILVTALAQVSIAFGLIILVTHRFAEHLNRLTLQDALTGALNRLALQRLAPRLLLRARQSQRPVCVAMVDADHFKTINDVFGHPVGDQVLCHLARTLAEQLRPGDLVIRYGGEEFLLILVDSALEATLAVAERLRAKTDQSPVPSDQGQVHYQVSIGISCSTQYGHDLNALIQAADSAMYHAKQEGRNRVCAA